MGLESINKIAHILRQDSLSFAYSGDFDDSYTISVIELNENHVGNSPDIRKLTKRINFLMGESFQNIVKHGVQKLKFEVSSDKTSCFMTQNINNAFYINASNVVPNTAVEPLIETLSKLNELSEAEVKQFYFKALGNATLSDKGGAGLGLIEMARKSKNKIDYSFEELDESNKLFFIKINLADATTDEIPPLSEFINFRRLIIKEKLLMVYKGDFSSTSIQPLMSVLQGNMKDLSSDLGKMKKAYIVFVEMIQNISKHGIINKSERAGVMTIGFEKEQFVFTTQNEISKENKDKIENLFSSVKDKTNEEIKKLYRKTLLEADDQDDSGSGVGIINIARFSENKFEYDFEECTPTSYNYAFKVTI